ncbi:VOC family protein [Microbulbifer sp. GL-2]|uniref:VOC family protein n=1 Tax=Microbulbifer sp. GL-2 TaxID=2591606 RepID=UPI001164C021|nr:VOC family protein [Microbulbifer sp. GL-2]BBM02957.1 glyoxalase/bleomycin resistance protein/dioxygenase superfamily protein [Microbulbifer sp. GL-2]
MKGIFHLSFVADNFETTRKFYEEVLGCRTGREKETWLDIHFFGHQLTIHRNNCPSEVSPIDHFGVILDKDEWHNLSERVSASNTGYVLSPNVIKIDTEAESGKYIIKDPSGNILEFKYYSELIHPMSEAYA